MALRRLSPLIILAASAHCTGNETGATAVPVPPPPFSIPKICTLPPGDPRLEEVETLCDGVDNDCDGLVDVLMPDGPNACQTGRPGACASGWAACQDGARVCMARGPAPETLDGADQDCNGVIDDIAPASVTPRALILVPPYMWTENPDEIDTLAGIFEEWGLPYDRMPAGGDWASYVSNLSRYAMVFVPGYVLGTSVRGPVRAALEAFAEAGGVVVLNKPVDNSGVTDATGLAGLTATAQRLDLTSIRFDGELAAATNAFDSPEERSIPLTEDAAGNAVEVIVLTAAPGTSVLGHAYKGTARAGAVATRRPLGKGAIYALGQDLHSFSHTRCYINCFEPSGDLIGLFLREALREGSRGHSVFVHTVPDGADTLLMVTHDVDAPDAHNAGSWGEAGAIQTARVERAHGAVGTFFVTTDYVSGYYNAKAMASLCDLGMCPLAAHSVRHADGMETAERGTCSETLATYSSSRPPTICGEIRVSQQILQDLTRMPVRVWRSPYLKIHPELYDVLAENGFLADSSFAVGDYKFNLPISLARVGLTQELFRRRPVYMFTIAIEDGIGWFEHGKEQREELQQKNYWKFMTNWAYVLLRNGHNGAMTNLLVHPSWGVRVGPENVKVKVKSVSDILDVAVKHEVPVPSMDTVAEFWRAREGVTVDAYFHSASGYRVTLRTGKHAVKGLTLAMGDRIGEVKCEACGPVAIKGQRLVFKELAAGAVFEITAIPR